MKEPIQLPDVSVEQIDIVKESPDDNAKEMYGTTFYPILYYSPSTGQCVVVLPNGLNPVFWRHIIDAGTAALVLARDKAT